MNGLERSWIKSALRSLELSQEVSPNIHVMGAINRLKTGLEIESHKKARAGEHCGHCNQLLVLGECRFGHTQGVGDRPKNPTETLLEKRLGHALVVGGSSYDRY